MTEPLSTLWDTLDSELIERLRVESRISFEHSNQPWDRLSEKVKRRLDEAWTTLDPDSWEGLAPQI
jgi:hypothetical protein